eukprot:1179782-Prorocentrum_minimum.AAC.3
MNPSCTDNHNDNEIQLEYAQLKPLYDAPCINRGALAQQDTICIIGRSQIYPAESKHLLLGLSSFRRLRECEKLWRNEIATLPASIHCGRIRVPAPAYSRVAKVFVALGQTIAELMPIAQLRYCKSKVIALAA